MNSHVETIIQYIREIMPELVATDVIHTDIEGGFTYEHIENRLNYSAERDYITHVERYTYSPDGIDEVLFAEAPVWGLKLLIAKKMLPDGETLSVVFAKSWHTFTESQVN